MAPNLKLIKPADEDIGHILLGTTGPRWEACSTCRSRRGPTSPKLSAC
jgi:hypothetical protein